LLARLQSRLSLLTGGARDVPARHQTLRATIDWSYHLLAPLEQTVFARLAVFVGGCTLEAAEAVCHLAGEHALDVLDVLQALVDQSLLQPVADPDAAPRFTLLETIREYALEHLAARGEGTVLQRQHALYYLALAETAAPELLDAQQARWRARLEVEYPNLRAALDWLVTTGEPELTLQLSAALCNFWGQRYYYAEGRQWLAAVRAQDPQRHDPALRAKVLGMAGTLAEMQGDYAEAQALGEESLALSRTAGATMHSARALDTLGRLAYQQGRYAQAQALFEESVALSRTAGSTWATGVALCKRAMVARVQGHTVQANALAEEGLALGRAAGLPWLVAMAIAELGSTAYEQGDYGQAEAHFTESLALSWEDRDELGSALDLERLAAVAGARGQAVRAARLFGAAVAVYAAVGWFMPPVDRAIYKRDLARARAQLDELTWAAAWADGQAMTLEQAVAYARAADGAHRMVGDPDAQGSDVPRMRSVLGRSHSEH
jgi:tetratricopeptide (TPR) repeat protein